MIASETGPMNLKRDHASLSRDVTPFDQGDHDEHNANLRQHQRDLADRKRRQDSHSE
jgi:hypothetical protein